MPWDIVASVVAPVIGDALFGGGGSSAPAPSGGGGGGGFVGQAVGGAVANYLSPADQAAAAKAADPFGPERAQYATKLSVMMNGGFTPDDPSYKWRMDQGRDAVDRGTAASGGLNSGGRLTALDQFGQGLASTEFQAQYTRLAHLAGADSGSPGAAGQILGQQNTQNQRSASTVGNAIGGAVSGIGQAIYDNWGNITGYTNDGGGGTTAGGGSSGAGSDFGMGSYGGNFNTSAGNDFGSGNYFSSSYYGGG